VLSATQPRSRAPESTEVHAPGDGALSGPKWMTVEGVLRDNGREAALGAGPGA